MESETLKSEIFFILKFCNKHYFLHYTKIKNIYIK